MATITTYSFDFSSPATVNGEVDVASLEAEIAAEPLITIGVLGSSTSGSDVHIDFKDTLPAPDQAALITLLAAHTGEALSEPATKDGTPIVHLDGPSEDDGKPVFVSSPGPKKYRTFFVGAGDDPNPTAPASGRGDGNKIGVDIPATDTFPKDYTVTWSYSEVGYIHDGQLCWRNPADFSRHDHFSLSVRGSASAPVVNGSGTGNCNLAPQPGYNLIVPSGGGPGGHDIDLATAIPVPAGKAANGFWDVDKSTGVITPSTTPGSAKWHLMDVPFASYFLKSIQMVNWVGEFEIDTYMAEWISERWFWQLDIHKEKTPAADCEVAGWIYLFREHTT